MRPEELQPLSRALREQLTEVSQRSSPTRRSAAYHSDIELVGRSQAFIQLMEQVGHASTTNLPVLVTGEVGTGKELVASTIHHRSDRSYRPFVAVNCGAIPAEQLEAALFGAESEPCGLWHEADGSTVFLNHITDTSLSLQVKLLRALETGETVPAGSIDPQKANVRVIAATSRNIDQEVAAGRFNKELLDRLSAVSIAVPPLRDRREDIPALAQEFADRVYSLNPSVDFSTEALALLGRYHWPENVRELENVVVRAAATCDGTIRVKDLPHSIRNYTMQDSAEAQAPTMAETTNEEWVTLSEIEGRYVARVLEHTCGNKQAAARVLAVDRKTLDRMIKRHHIDTQHARAQRAKSSQPGA